jgi:electron transfer flavoprotein alpha subunit
MSSVLIVVEYADDKPKKATLNALTFARQAAEKINAELHLLVIGNGVQPIAEALQPYGADAIHLVEDPAYQNYTAELWGHVVAEVAKGCGAVIVGMNSGTTGRDLIPRVAGKLNAGMASDIVAFDGICFIRGMWAGNVLATVDVKTPVKVATIQGTAFPMMEPTGGKTPIHLVQVPAPKTKTRFIEMQASRSDRPDPTEATVVVSGGRGMKSKENFNLIESLADLFGGAVGASRAAVDSGWISNDLQVGQTGKTVAPDLYIAVGISGAIQHLAGMKNSKVIVAINKDEEAPIFQVADYGLVGDLFKVIPELTEALKKELT